LDRNINGKKDDKFLDCDYAEVIFLKVSYSDPSNKRAAHLIIFDIFFSNACLNEPPRLLIIENTAT
jgi:hypothetical protein